MKHLYSFLAVIGIALSVAFLIPAYASERADEVSRTSAGRIGRILMGDSTVSPDSDCSHRIGKVLVPGC